MLSFRPKLISSQTLSVLIRIIDLYQEGHSWFTLRTRRSFKTTLNVYVFRTFQNLRGYLLRLISALQVISKKQQIWLSKYRNGRADWHLSFNPHFLKE